ncbi:hypothetical protein F8388_009828 [Cannabis sativa]|uniref:Uncharacterized protein n=1 Tax=Cannabis sativa TaxID=3483 RepID=A0A7J6H3J9_CANSA|nr:hypothetical protein F8388_009828 [Cannabis sativa]
MVFSSRYNRLDDMLFKVSSNLIIGNSFIMLCRDENSVDTNGNHGAIVIDVFDSNLCLSIRSQPRTCPILPDFSETSTKLGSKNMAEGHELRSLISGITKHVTLITSSNFLRALSKVAVNTLSNIRTLLLDVNQNFALVSIKTNIIRNESNRTAGVTGNLFIVNFGFGCDLTKHHNHIGLCTSFTGDLAVRVLS